ncbi:MAG: AzlC family ABC transporter permease [Burkholderiaceae bacterium]|nr:AzlC family ABC transporter permease [Burkholderiaceae bacterium]
MTETAPDSRPRDDRERSAFWDAVRISMQTVPGLFAWGAVTGMAMVQSGLSLWQSLLMTLVVYAGSAQLAALPLIAAGAPLGVIVFTALMVNLRFVIFSAVIGPHFRHLPWPKRLWYGYQTVDLVMAFFPQRYPAHTVDRPAGKLGYLRGLVVPNWWAWQLGTLAGILLASQIPPSWGVGFAGSLALLAMTIPLVKSRPTVAGVIVSGGVAVAAAGWPYRLGLLLAIVLGIATAVAVEQALAKREAKP